MTLPVILQTDKQTNTCSQKHNLLGRCNNINDIITTTAVDDSGLCIKPTFFPQFATFMVPPNAAMTIVS